MDPVGSQWTHTSTPYQWCWYLLGSLSGHDAAYNVVRAFVIRRGLLLTQNEPVGYVSLCQAFCKTSSSAHPCLARQGTQRESTAKLAVNRTKLVGVYISVVDLLGLVQSGAVPC